MCHVSSWKAPQFASKSPFTGCQQVWRRSWLDSATRSCRCWNCFCLQDNVCLIWHSHPGTHARLGISSSLWRPFRALIISALMWFPAFAISCWWPDLPGDYRDVIGCEIRGVCQFQPGHPPLYGFVSRRLMRTDLELQRGKNCRCTGKCLGPSWERKVIQTMGALGGWLCFRIGKCDVHRTYGMWGILAVVLEYSMHFMCLVGQWQQ